MSAPLNLARRPLRNERLPTLLLALACALLGALTARHAIVAAQLRHGGERDLEAQVAALEAEVARLRTEGEGLRREAPPAAVLGEWEAVKALVDRRAFSWTGLFAALETALPPSVRLMSVAPSAGSGPLRLTLQALGRQPEDALGLVKALRASPAFSDAFLDSVSQSAEGYQIACTVAYAGGAATAASRPGPAVAAQAAPGGAP